MSSTLSTKRRKTDDDNDTATADTDDARGGKKRSKVVDDLICPITMELPFDPVTADDGRIYEKAAIQRHIKEHSGMLRSPVTNETMTDRVVASPQMKNLIQNLIDDGFMADSDLVDSWKQKRDLWHKAETGDADAMEKLARNFRFGTNGFEKNKILSLTWTQKAHEAGSVRATARLGMLLVEDNDKENFTIAVAHWAASAAQGSAFGAYRLGFAYADGGYGLPVNVHEAIKWLKKSLSPCSFINDLSDCGKETAKTMLSVFGVEEVY